MKAGSEAFKTLNYPSEHKGIVQSIWVACSVLARSSRPQARHPSNPVWTRGPCPEIHLENQFVRHSGLVKAATAAQEIGGIQCHQQPEKTSNTSSHENRLHSQSCLPQRSYFKGRFGRILQHLYIRCRSVCSPLSISFRCGPSDPSGLIAFQWIGDLRENPQKPTGKPGVTNHIWSWKTVIVIVWNSILLSRKKKKLPVQNDKNDTLW